MQILQIRMLKMNPLVKHNLCHFILIHTTVFQSVHKHSLILHNLRMRVYKPCETLTVDTINTTSNSTAFLLLNYHKHIFLFYNGALPPYILSHFHRKKGVHILSSRPYIFRQDHIFFFSGPYILLYQYNRNFYSQNESISSFSEYVFGVSIAL